MPGLPAVYGDKVRLLEVMQNLIDNAVKYMGNQPEPCIEVGWRRDGEETVCYVRDKRHGYRARVCRKKYSGFSSN